MQESCSNLAWIKICCQKDSLLEEKYEIVKIINFNEFLRYLIYRTKSREIQNFKSRVNKGRGIKRLHIIQTKTN